MKRNCFSALGQRLLPRALRVPAGPRTCRAASPATAFALALAESAPPAPAAPPPGPRPEQMPEGVAVELCNFLHRIGLGIRELRGAEGLAKPARGLGLAFEQMRQRLKAEGVEFTDLTGHPWSPERADFECTGKPRAKLGIEAAVIESCERPAVTIGGELVQKARGEALRPPSAANDADKEENA